MITYNGESKVIRRLCEFVNAVYNGATEHYPRLIVDGDGYVCADYGEEESGNGE